MADWTAPMLSGLQHESPRPCHSTIGRYSLGLLGPREDRIPPRSFLPRSYLGRTSLGSAALHIARFDRSINSWTHARAANACCTRDVGLCDCILSFCRRCRYYQAFVTRCRWCRGYEGPSTNPVQDRWREAVSIPSGVCSEGLMAAGFVAWSWGLAGVQYGTVDIRSRVAPYRVRPWNATSTRGTMRTKLVT